MQNWNDEPGNKTAAASENHEDTIWVQQEGFRTTIREVSKRDIQRVAEGDKLDLVEVLAPLE
jgi:hypothetical protein